MRFHVRAQYHGIVYLANTIQKHMFYVRGRDGVNLLELNQLTRLICL